MSQKKWLFFLKASLIDADNLTFLNLTLSPIINKIQILFLCRKEMKKMSNKDNKLKQTGEENKFAACFQRSTLHPLGKQ